MKILKKRSRLFKKTDIQNTTDRNILISSARIASESAIRTSRALGLTIKSIENGKLIETYADGSVVTLRELTKVTSKKQNIRKGISICLK